MRVLSSIRGVLFLSSPRSRSLHTILKQNAFGVNLCFQRSCSNTSPPTITSPPPPAVEKLIQPNKIYSCEFIWVIPQFRLRYGGSKIVSPRFSPKNINYEWFLRLDPGQESSKLPQENQLGLVLVEDSKSYKILGAASGEWSVAILDSKGEKHCTNRICFHNSINESMKCRLMKRADLLNATNEPLFLPDGQLSIHCHLSFVLPGEDSIVDHNFIREDYSKYFNKEDCSDVVISINGNHYPAHKFVLAARNPVLKAKLEQNVVENQKIRIDIEDVDEKAFLEILRYIYTGKAENLKSMPFQLLHAADKFNVVRLKLLCEEQIKSTLKNETAAEALIFADKHNFKNLKKVILEYTKENCSEDSIELGHWQKLISHPNLLMDLLRNQIKYRDDLQRESESDDWSWS